MAQDIATEPLWARCREMARRTGCERAGLSLIRDGDNRVLGTFASYFRSPGQPTEWHRRLIEVTTYTAALAIVHDRARHAAAQREAQFAEAQRIAHMGSYSLNFD